MFSSGEFSHVHYLEIGALLAFVLCVLFHICLKKGRRNDRPPLAAYAWPIIGHTSSFIKKSEDYFKVVIELSKDCLQKGGVTLLQIAGKDMYAIVDPDDANTVLNSCLQKDFTYDFLKPLFGEGLLTATDAVWKRHRKILSPTFNQVVLDSYLTEFNKQARLLVEIWEARVGKGKFDHGPDIEQANLRTICSTAMGIAIDQEDKTIREEYMKARKKFFEVWLERIQQFWFHNEFIYSFSDLKKKQDELAGTLHGLTNAMIKKRKADMAKKEVNEVRYKPFLELLLELAQKGELIDNEVKEEVDTLIFAGAESTSVALMIVLLNIASYSDVQTKIFHELKYVFNGSDRDVQKQDLVQFKYLEAVINESTRLHSVVPIVARTLDKDVKIKKYTLPAGSRCVVSLYGVNRHTVWGPEADKFQPERWLDPNCIPNHAFATFGLGRRMCLGSNFAMMSVKTTLAHILRRYHVTGDVTQLEQKMDLVGRPVPKDYISIESTYTVTTGIESNKGIEILPEIEEELK